MNKKAKNKFRKFINDIHLWLGLGAGIILFIVCLSGTIYTFKSEIEYLINPSKYDVAAFDTSLKPLAIEKLINDLEKQEKAKVSFFKIPVDPTKNYQLGLVKKEKKENKAEGAVKKENKKGAKKDEKPKRVRPVTYYVDPYTGKVMGKDGDSTSRFFMTMMKLHRWLLLDDTVGRPIVGIATIIFIILSISGFILWLPKKFKHWKKWTHWKPGLKIKFDAKWKRINHDLHNTLGFYSLVFLLLMAFTGLCWSFDWYRVGFSKILGREVFAGRDEKPIQIKYLDMSSLSFTQIVDKTNKELMYPGDIRISLPKDSVSALTITKNKIGFFAVSGSDKLVMNQYTGEVLQRDIFKEKALNEQIVSQIKPLHVGDIFGTFSKIIYFITCLIGTSLPITGVFIWINKMKKSENKKQKI